MRLLQPTCPTCHQQAKGTVEALRGLATIAIEEDGSYDHDGDGTTIWWDEAKTIENEAGDVNLLCPNGHDWFSKVEKPDPSSSQEPLQKKINELEQAVTELSRQHNELVAFVMSSKRPEPPLGEVRKLDMTLDEFRATEEVVRPQVIERRGYRTRDDAIFVHCYETSRGSHWYIQQTERGNFYVQLDNAPATATEISLLEQKLYEYAREGGYLSHPVKTKDK